MAGVGPAARMTIGKYVSVRFARWELFMFVTRDFVFLHLPKTGGTFVRSALDRLERQRGKTFVHRAARKVGLPVTVELPPHGTWRELPVAYRGREVLTVVRSPYDRYVSEYHFHRGEFRECPGWFGQANPVIAARWPAFLDLSYEQYVRYGNEECTFLRFPGFAAEDQPGMYAQHFLYFFAKNLEATVRDLTPGSVRDGRLLSSLPRMRFLQMHDLNEQLRTYLLERGYSARRIEFIRDMGRVLPQGRGRKSDDAWEQYYTPALKAYVRNKERLLFELFPEFDQAGAEAPLRAAG